MNNNSNNMDINSIMTMLSKMDKKDLAQGLEKASKLLNSKDKEEILKNLNNLK